MSLPPGFEQIYLFAAMATDPEPKPKPKRRQKRKGIVYSCPKCKKTIEVDIPAVVIFFRCGRRMEREEEK